MARSDPPHAVLRSGAPALRAALAVAAATLAGPGAGAEPERPASAQRTVQSWDFDDPLSRFEPVPPGWFRAQDAPPDRARPDYPAWNVPALSTAASFSPPYAMHLPTRGGNTSLMLSGGVVAALPMADYAVSAAVRTDGLRHARARLSAWLLDDRMQPIPGTASHSTPAETGGEWRAVETEIRGSERAAWIQVELAVLQPRSFETAPSGQHVWPEDFAGSAFFDDVVISQIPRVDLETVAPSNFFVAPEQPEILALVRDMAGETLTIELTALDIDGAPVDRATLPVPHGGRRVPWRPSLPGFGWYSVEMRVRSGEQPVGERTLALVWAPNQDKPAVGARQSFAVAAESITPAQRAALPELLQRMLCGSASIAVWTPGLSLDEARQAVHTLADDAERLLSRGIDLTFVLTNIPAELAREARIDPDDPIPLLTDEDEAWAPYLSRILASFGERVRRWQFGPTGGASVYFRPNLAEEISAIRAKLRRTVPRPVVAAPWSLRHPHDAGAAAGIDEMVTAWPLGVPAHAIEQAAPHAAARTLVIETPPAHRYGHRAGAVELARRAVSAWAVGARRLVLTEPWAVHQDAPDRLHPAATAAVWRTMSAMLADAEIVGRLPVAEGATVYIARSPRGGMLIGWNETAEPDHAVIEGWLASGTVLVHDPFGNTEPAAADEHGRVSVRLEEMPLFLTGVDVNLALFRSRLRVEPPFIPARAERHALQVVVENPWPVGITGRLRLAEPASWNITPRVIPFELAPGASQRVPVDLFFTLGEEAGRQIITVEAAVSAERHYPVMRLPLELEIGLPNVELIASYRIDPRPGAPEPDLVVSLLVTNQGASPLTVEAFAQGAGYRAFSAPISALEPGQAVTRRFRFPGGGERLKGSRVRVGLRETGGTGRLNRTLVIE